MEFMEGFISVLIDIAKNPAVLVAIIALLGLLLQKKSAGEVVKGTLKTMVGFLVLVGGAGIIVSSLEPFGAMFQFAFNVQGVVPNNEAIVAVALQEYGTTTALIMLLGMVVNILIAAFTAFKHIFLTGHHTLYMACLLAVIFEVVGFSGFWLIIVGALALGAIMSLSPYILQRYTDDITGQKKGVGLGHFGGGGYWMAGFTGELLRGKKDRKDMTSTEDLNFPKWLSFMRDSTVAIAVTMMFVYLIVALVAGPKYFAEKHPDDGNYIVFAIVLGAKFAAGTFVILQGVRLILNEIVPAFKGISERLVPNSIPAL